MTDTKKRLSCSCNKKVWIASAIAVLALLLGSIAWYMSTTDNQANFFKVRQNLKNAEPSIEMELEPQGEEFYGTETNGFYGTETNGLTQ